MCVTIWGEKKSLKWMRSLCCALYQQIKDKRINSSSSNNRHSIRTKERWWKRTQQHQQKKLCWKHFAWVLTVIKLTRISKRLFRCLIFHLNAHFLSQQNEKKNEMRNDHFFILFVFGVELSRKWTGKKKNVNR